MKKEVKELRYFQIKNWKKFQHYKHRNPTWIKLHTSILTDFAFNHLSPRSRLTLMLLWVYSSTTHGQRILFDLKELKFQLRLNFKIDLNPLFDAGFIEWCENPASTMLAQCVQLAPKVALREQSTKLASEAAVGEPVRSSTDPSALYGRNRNGWKISKREKEINDREIERQKNGEDEPEFYTIPEDYEPVELPKEFRIPPEIMKSIPAEPDDFAEKKILAQKKAKELLAREAARGSNGLLTGPSTALMGVEKTHA